MNGYLRRGITAFALGVCFLLSSRSDLYGQQPSGSFRSGGASATWGLGPTTAVAGRAGFSSTGSSWGKGSGEFSTGSWGAGRGTGLPAAPQAHVAPPAPKATVNIAPSRPVLRVAAPAGSANKLGGSSLRAHSTGRSFASSRSSSGTAFGGRSVAASGPNTRLGGPSLGTSSINSSFGATSLLH